MLNKILRIYSYITAILFFIFIFGLFAAELSETCENQKGKDVGIKAIVSDMESVDSVIYPFININGAFQNIMKRDYIYDAKPSNAIIKKKSGYIVSTDEKYDRKDIEKCVADLQKKQERLACYGIPLVYIQAPGKMSGSPERSMPGLHNYTYDKYADFKEEAENATFDYVDTKAWMSKDWDKNFYVTDHHWKTEVCLDAAYRFCSYLSDEYGISADTDALREENFRNNTLKQMFLGAEGRRTGIWYAGLDDFTVITPKYETNFDVWISDKEKKHHKRKGSFEEAVMDTTKDLSKYSFEKSAYYAYWGGDYGRVHVVNNNVRGKGKVMVIKDSYGIPVTAFMSCALSEMDILDYRYYKEDKSIWEIIEEERPDAVLYIYGTGYLTYPSMF